MDFLTDEEKEKIAIEYNLKQLKNHPIIYLPEPTQIFQKVRYDEKFNSKRIIKIRKASQTEDTESILYISDDELPEDITKVGFCLDQVEGWEEYNDPFNKFINKQPKVVVHVYGFEDLILLESFEYFNLVMEEFYIRQQNNGNSNTEGIKTI